MNKADKEQIRKIRNSKDFRELEECNTGKYCAERATRQKEAIQDCLDNINDYPDYTIKEILQDAGVPMTEWTKAYDKEFN